MRLSSPLAGARRPVLAARADVEQRRLRELDPARDGEALGELDRARAARAERERERREHVDALARRHGAGRGHLEHRVAVELLAERERAVVRRRRRREHLGGAAERVALALELHGPAGGRHAVARDRARDLGRLAELRLHGRDLRADGRGSARRRGSDQQQQCGQEHRAHRSDEGSGADRVAAPGCPAPAAHVTPCPAPASAFSRRRPGWRPTRCSSTSRTPSPQSEKAARARARDRGAARARLRRHDRRRARQRHRHAALLPRPDRRGRAGGRPARRGDAAEGAHARRRRDDRQAADGDRARARAAGRPDRHRGADRGRHRAARVRGDRRRVAADGEPDLRARATTARRSVSRSPRSAARPSTTPATTSTTSSPASSSPPARPASRRSTGRTRRSTTTTACAPARGSPARSGWTASGRSTRARSRP